MVVLHYRFVRFLNIHFDFELQNTPIENKCLVLMVTRGTFLVCSVTFMRSNLVVVLNLQRIIVKNLCNAFKAYEDDRI